MPRMDDVNIITVTKGVELADRIKGLFPERDIQVTRESSLDRVLERFENGSYDVLLVTSDAFKAGEIDGIELLEVIAEKSPVTQVLFLAEKRDIRIAMSALRAGTYQYARFPISDEELRLLVVEGVGWLGLGLPRENIIEPQLGFALRYLITNLQRGQGCGHGLVGILEVDKARPYDQV